jgi:uncharacterized protein (TIGR00369 family)
MDRLTINDNTCFCCGKNNTHGLQLEFTYPEKGKARTKLTIPAYFSGWKDITHGGLLSMLLDETMAHACGSAGEWALTAELSIRFVKPVQVKEGVVVEAVVTEKKSRLIKATGRITNSAGETIATGSARFISSTPPSQDWA